RHRAGAGLAGEGLAGEGLGQRAESLFRKAVGDGPQPVFCARPCEKSLKINGSLLQHEPIENSAAKLLIFLVAGAGPPLFNHINDLAESGTQSRTIVSQGLFSRRSHRPAELTTPLTVLSRGF